MPQQFRTNIATGIAPPEDPAASYAQAVNLRDMMDQRKQRRVLVDQQIEDRRQQTQIHEQTLADKRRAEKLATDTQGAYAAGGTDDEISARVRAVNAPASFQFDTDRRASRKADLANELDQMKVDHGKVEELGAIAGAMVDEDSFHRGIGSALAKKYITPQEAAELLAMPWGPEAQARVKAFQTGALSAKDQVAAAVKAAEDLIKKEEHQAKLPGLTADSAVKVAEAGQVAKVGPDGRPQGMTDKEAQTLAGAAETRTQTAANQAAVLAQTTKRDAATERHQANTEAITKRGQTLTDTRERDRNTIQKDQKPATSAENRAMSFYLRAQDASGVLDSMADMMGGKGLVGQARYKFAPNFLQSEDNQIYRQAQRSFTEARLRKDSGAAIPLHEFAMDAKTYFPEPGDTPKGLARKKTAREQILRGLHIESGRAVKTIGDTPGDLPSPGSKPAAGPPKKDPMGIR